ncbi:MAG: hypothetical protein WC222_11365 [Parachlamydiales bacterium]|jgi:hypothetical protein
MAKCSAKKVYASVGLSTSKNIGKTKWTIVKDLKDMPTHEQGGVDVQIGLQGVSFKHSSGKEIHAAYGLYVPKKKEYISIGATATHERLTMPTTKSDIQIPNSVIYDPQRLENIEDQTWERTRHAQIKKGWEEQQARLLEIPDTRTINPATNQPIRPNADLFSIPGVKSFDPELIKETFRFSKKYGVDPYEALAVLIQESKLGTATHPDFSGKPKDPTKAKVPVGKANIGHVLDKEIIGQSLNPIERSILGLKKANDSYKGRYAELGITYPAEEETYRRLQVYNGLDKLYPDTEIKYHGGPVNAFYGVPVTKDNPIDLTKNPIYGKVIVSVTDVLQKNADIQRLYNEIYGESIVK